MLRSYHLLHLPALIQNVLKQVPAMQEGELAIPMAEL
jgi:hypothetical protein